MEQLLQNYFHINKKSKIVPDYKLVNFFSENDGFGEDCIFKECYRLTTTFTSSFCKLAVINKNVFRDII